MIFYICNRKRCAVCDEYCRHTTDPAFAAHPDAKPQDFIRLKGGHLWEEVKDEGEGLRKYSETIC